MNAFERKKRVKEGSTSARRERFRHLIEDYLAREKKQKFRLMLLCRALSGAMKFGR